MNIGDFKYRVYTGDGELTLELDKSMVYSNSNHKNSNFLYLDADRIYQLEFIIQDAKRKLNLK